MKDSHARRITTTTIISIFFFLLLFIPLSLYIISKNQQSAKNIRSISTPIQKAEPTITPQQPTPTPYISLPASLAPTVNPQMHLLEIIQNRPPLSATDLSAKNNIIRMLPDGQYSGVVYRAADFTVDYVQNPDLFQVEVLITDTEKAKQEALDWFRNEGISQQGICNLPIDFYLNSDVKNQITNPDAFNPLPDGC
jgi:hypothetical protein